MSLRSEHPIVVPLFVMKRSDLAERINFYNASDFVLRHAHFYSKQDDFCHILLPSFFMIRFNFTINVKTSKVSSVQVSL
jgi:hypothetical protein